MMNDIWTNIFNFMTCKEIMNCMICSKNMYAIGHKHEIWNTIKKSITKKFYKDSNFETVRIANVLKPCWLLLNAFYSGEFDNFDNIYAPSVLGTLYTVIPPLPEEIKYLSNTTKIRWVACDIEIIPQELYMIPNLTKLNLEYNKISEITHYISYFTNLKKLNLNCNPINKISNEISKLINLESLYLNEINITSIPHEIYSLTNLKYLSLCENKLRTIDHEIGKLLNLKELDLSGNPIKEISREIIKLTNLSKLSLNKEGIHALPDGIKGNMTCNNHRY